MCLGIPGQVVEAPRGTDLARVDVAGVVRDINVALLDSPLAPGDFILIHSGFALERLTPDEARAALVALGGSHGPPAAARDFLGEPP
jgi:hydrogenase expression/formation protein HypC